jgi:pilus assembly protein Flp/PilA
MIQNPARPAADPALSSPVAVLWVKYAVNYSSEVSADDLTASQSLVYRIVHDPNGSGNGHWVELTQPRMDPGNQLMKTLVSRFVKDESGATAVELGLIAAGISVAIIVVVLNLVRGP